MIWPWVDGVLVLIPVFSKLSGKISSPGPRAEIRSKVFYQSNNSAVWWWWYSLFSLWFMSRMRTSRANWSGSILWQCSPFLSDFINLELQLCRENLRRRPSQVELRFRNPASIDVFFLTFCLFLNPYKLQVKIRLRYLCTVFYFIYQGILTSETRCLNCETITSKDEDFFDLSIDVDQVGMSCGSGSFCWGDPDSLIGMRFFVRSCSLKEKYR